LKIALLFCGRSNRPHYRFCPSVRSSVRLILFCTSVAKPKVAWTFRGVGVISGKGQDCSVKRLHHCGFYTLFSFQVRSKHEKERRTNDSRTGKTCSAA